ncbi:MAG TPA: TniQ family protein [Dermatophilaceae bacterium]|nr:TniQ family protein [Propioniciclava tarda]HOF37680.1 TniQ family protein [Dermatophilaceae bacterium]HOR16668.1 TniQ family protein [Dermatophilaceae bacterium]HPK91129.1 TniQ family protein [Dermatophilaceae bacterium]
MTPAAWPVRPEPRPGEPLTSYAVRLADANGLPRGMAIDRHRRDIDVPADELDTVAALACLDAGAAGRLTMDRYPPTVRGRGPTHRGGWRLHFSVEWVCPRCTDLTGRRELLWQTALSPVCRECRLLLVPAGSLADPVTVSSPRLVDLVDELTALAEASVLHQSARVRLGAFRRVCALVAQTIDDQWPDRPSGLPALDVAAARWWGVFPSPDPGTVAVIVSAAAPALRSGHARDQLLREGAQRCRRGRTLAVPPQHVPNASRYLPKRPPSPPKTAPVLAGFNRDDARRLDWLTTQLTHQVRRHGIHPDHVPALLPAPGEDGLPDSAVWRARWHCAIALHMLLTHVHDGPTSSARACHAFGTTDEDTSPLLDGIRLGRGIHDLDVARLTDAVDALVDSGLVDYQRRRDTLRPITRLPRLPIARARLPEIDELGGTALALNWIWTRLTHGPSFTSPRPFIADRHVRAFDAAFDPETRLALTEAGQQLLADADLLTIPCTRATWPAVTRSYG